MNTKQGSQSKLYRLDEDGQSALATTLQFGAETKDTIEIVSGASVNQRFILSDMSRWQDHEKIAIVQ